MASFGAAGEVVFLLRGFLLLYRGMLELAVLEAEIERSHIKVNREVGVRLRLLDRRRDLLVRCSPVPPLPSLLPFRPRPSICSPSPPFLLIPLLFSVCRPSLRMRRLCSSSPLLFECPTPSLGPWDDFENVWGLLCKKVDTHPIKTVYVSDLTADNCG
jgi:hypothetical protein